MNKVWTRQQAESDTAAVLDASKDAPQVIEDVDGHFVLTFSRTGKMPVKDWAKLPGTLDDDDEL
ncbi:MAG: hypothetical protein AAGD15_08575 [Agrobacterium cavarae]|uniref:hypothetical protein n=1 Tax=Agrobacterium cavarae TaxID=2528239 RepID=UPI000DE0F5DF|nr:hypothetical protein [Agrobacterium cavarae]